jgi:nitrite reductase/ring-hydroxylating ferredoxin subunit
MDCLTMDLNRREFLMMATATAVAAASEVHLLAADGLAVDAGPVANFAKDGVYGDFRALGFFVVRKGGKLFALSSICPHRHTTLVAKLDCSFLCKRHGSTFTPTGHVTEGPAKRDMPMLATSVSASGHLLVSVPA